MLRQAPTSAITTSSAANASRIARTRSPSLAEAVGQYAALYPGACALWRARPGPRFFRKMGPPNRIGRFARAPQQRRSGQSAEKPSGVSHPSRRGLPCRIMCVKSSADFPRLHSATRRGPEPAEDMPIRLQSEGASLWPYSVPIGSPGFCCWSSRRSHTADTSAQTLAESTAQLKVVEVNEPDGQILSYRHLAGSTEVQMRGTKLAPESRVQLKIGSRPGFVELDINRGGISGLKPAHHLGEDFLTYVLWAVSIDGKASNLGEITFRGRTPGSCERHHAVPDLLAHGHGRAQLRRGRSQRASGAL